MLTETLHGKSSKLSWCKGEEGDENFWEKSIFSFVSRILIYEIGKGPRPARLEYLVV